MNFSQSILNGTDEQLQIELDKIENIKKKLITEKQYEQSAKARDWQKRILQEIERRKNISG